MANARNENCTTLRQQINEEVTKPMFMPEILLILGKGRLNQYQRCKATILLGDSLAVPHAEVTIILISPPRLPREHLNPLSKCLLDIVR